MDDREKSTACEARIVVLSQDSSLAWSTDLRRVPVVFAHAASGYEAAAELLAEPTAALVIDLRLLAGRHLRLLEIARDLDVELFALGSLPIGMTAEDLSGVRLIARRDLPAAVEALAAEPSAPPAPAEPPEAEVAERIAPAEPIRLTAAKTPEPDTAAAEPVGSGPDGPDALLASVGLPPAIEKALHGRSSRSRGAEARRSARVTTSDSHEPEADEADKQTPPPASIADNPADGLLSTAELNALLGDEK